MIKSFHIAFTDVFSGDGEQLGTISLAKRLITFHSSFTVFSREQYEDSWRTNIKKAVVDRNLSALFSDVYADEDGNGYLNCFSVVPSELASLNEIEDLNDEEQELGLGVYITDIAAFFACLRPENLRIPRYVESEDKTLRFEVPVVFFDTTRPEGIFAHLSTDISDSDWWYISNEDMLEALESDLKP